MNNSVHIKTIENLKNRVDIRLTNSKDYQKSINKPRFVSQKIFKKKIW